MDLTACSNDNYALFAGGQASGTTLDKVDFYNEGLTKCSNTNLRYKRYGLASVAIGNYFLVAGGYINENYSCINNVEAFNYGTSMQSISYLTYKKRDLISNKVGDYALFAGGQAHPYQVGSEYVYFNNIIDVYNSSLTKCSNINLSNIKYYAATATIGNYALFAGGQANNTGGTYFNDVDAYDSSLTKIVAANLLNNKRCIGTSLNNYALFIGGNYISYNNDTGTSDITYFNEIEAYDSSLTKIVINNCLSNANLVNGSVSIKSEYVLVFNRNSNYSDVFDSSLTKTLTNSFEPTNAYGFGVTSIGDYALIGGGYSSKPLSDVHVYTTA